MSKHVRCGTLFTGGEDAARTDCTMIVGDDGRITHVGPTAEAPPPGRGDTVVDHSARFVMPGLLDVHTHLAYGNAKTEEDIDLYQPLEFRSLRALFFAQKCIAAGYTSICAPGDAGQISLSVRNAIRAGLFDGPRVTAAGRYLTTRQGLTDWYPTWIGAPETSIGRLVASKDEAVEEIRCQVKNGVDCIKIAMDGFHRRANGELVAAFTQEETDVMVAEAHRLGKKVVVHARGREATLYSARAGVDLIFHAYHLDDECIDALLASGSAIGPTLTFPRNICDFTQPHEPAYIKGRIADVAREFEVACENLRRAKKAGIAMMTGTDSGFAVTPYGEWHARELEIFVQHLGFTPAEALRAATEGTARFMADGDRVGVLAPGKAADFIVVDGSPLANVSILLDKSRILAVHIDGKEMRIPERGYDPRKVTDFAWTNWTDLYTQERVAELRGHARTLAAAQ
ncbi:MAG: amidohydrolase family protein [Alphaproteobacteria bacterium]|nr:amidohydrolase family protein [Alphaproteobacteria bacterium]